MSAVLLCLAFIYAAWNRIPGQEHSKVTIYSVVLDTAGNVLVDDKHETLPQMAIPVLNNAHSFNTASPLFQWFYRASRNWLVVQQVLPSMREHVTKADVPSNDVSTSARVQLCVAAREQFCSAVESLAESMGTSMTSMGICFDEVVSAQSEVCCSSNAEGTGLRRMTTEAEIEFGSRAPCQGRGANRNNDPQSIFLVRQVTEHEKRQFSKGYRFLPSHEAAKKLAITTGLTVDAMNEKLELLLKRHNLDPNLEPGLHVAFLSMKIDHDQSQQILVTSSNTDLLPTSFVQDQHMSVSDLTLLQKHFHLTLRELSQACSASIDESRASTSRRSSALALEDLRLIRRQSAWDLEEVRSGRRSSTSLGHAAVPMKRQSSVPQEFLKGRTEVNTFASRLFSAIERLDDLVGHQDLLTARFVPQIFTLPCQGRHNGKFAFLAIFRLDCQQNEPFQGSDLEWSTFEMFNTKITTRLSKFNDDFIRGVLEEFSTPEKVGLSYFDKKATTTHETEISVTELASSPLGSQLYSPPLPSPYKMESRIEEIITPAEQLTWIEEALLKSATIFQTW